MRAANFIFPFFCLFLLSSCLKEKANYHFSGKVFDAETHFPVSGAFVTVSEIYHNNKECKQDFGKVYTDAAGNYEFTSDYIYKRQEDASILATSVYIESGDTVIPFIAPGENHNDMAVKTRSHLSFHIVNQYPFDQHDSLFNIFIDRPFGNQYVGGNNRSFTGTSTNTILTASFFGYTSHVLHYSVRKNSIIQNYSRTISTPDPYLVGTVQDSIRY